VSRDDSPPDAREAALAELMRVQPFEAEVIAARLRASGIDAIVGPGSPYESLGFASGVPIFVPADDVLRAKAVLEGDPG
jgi:hypothetical protein